MNLLHDLIYDYTLRNVALGSAVLGIVSGVTGGRRTGVGAECRTGGVRRAGERGRVRRV